MRPRIGTPVAAWFRTRIVGSALQFDKVLARTRRDASVFVAMEQSATWPVQLGACSEGHAGTAVVVQGPGESPGRFARRCASRLGQLDVAGHALDQAVIVIGSSADVEARFARMAIAQALLRRMALERDPTLFLAGPARLSDDGRQELAALARLLTRFGARAVRIRVYDASGADPDPPPLSARSFALLAEAQV